MSNEQCTESRMLLYIRGFSHKYDIFRFPFSDRWIFRNPYRVGQKVPGGLTVKHFKVAPLGFQWVAMRPGLPRHHTQCVARPFFWVIFEFRPQFTAIWSLVHTKVAQTGPQWCEHRLRRCEWRLTQGKAAPDWCSMMPGQCLEWLLTCVVS